MTPDLLMKHFDRISEAPDAVPRLRRFILDLAVRGKLVEQDPQDQPASELLKLITAEKLQLAGHGTILSSKSSSHPPSDQLPFDLKPGWQATRFSQILVELQTGPFGSSLHRSDYEENGTPVINPASIKNGRLVPVPGMAVGPQTIARLATFKLRENDIVMARRGEMGRCAIVSSNEKGWLCGTGSLVLRLPKCVFQPFIVLLIGSPLVREYLNGSAVGATMQNLNQGILLNLIIALPPLAEQRRIVAKVGELMALCDQLEASRSEREKCRNKLVAAATHGLSNGHLPRELLGHATFYFNNLPHLTATRKHINMLRKSILNLAIKGSLVLHDTGDRPASELLERIHLEKLAMVSRNELKKSDLGQPPKPSQFEIPLPSGWAPATLQQLCVSVTDGDHLPPPKADEGVPFLVIGNVRTQLIEFAGCRYVPEEYYRALDPIRCPRKGDILYTLVGSYGIPVIVTDDRRFCVQRHIGILRPSPLLNLKFLHRVLESEWVFRQATAVATGIAQKTVPLAGLRKLLVPLPPLAEQTRIVTRVDALMALCDELDARLKNNANISLQLLEAVLNVALNPELQKDLVERVAI